MTQEFSQGVVHRFRWLLVAVTVIGGVWGIRYLAGTEDATAQAPARAPARPAAGTRTAATAKPQAAKGQPGPAQSPTDKQPIVALVNGQTIMRDELAKECLRHHGTEVLESLVNRRLIDKHCRDNGVQVSQQEIDEEIDRIARKFSLPKDQYLKMLEKERGIQPAQYGRDIIWPTLALRKLAAPHLTVSREELNQAYESQFGVAVKARMIVLESKEEAQQVLAMALAKPEEFGALARKYSKDVNSASSNGLIQPIRKHLGDPLLEQAAFQLQPDEISPVVAVNGQFIILKCEGMIEPLNPDRKSVEAILTEAIKDRKLRSAAAETFNMLQKTAQVRNIMNDPELSKKYPGVAATVNGLQISVAELAEQCVERHGKDVLEGTINRCLLEQALKRRKQTVTENDLEEEIGRAAVSMGKVLPNKQPDIEGWLEMVTTTQQISEAVYRHDVVWPSAAMKKIVHQDAVQVTEEDLRKGFEANYGPRVRCRAIVFNSQRKAQEVWDMARKNLTAEYFGDLAEEYSIEANSRSLRGEVPPIQKWGGQPVLEDEAFALQAGELSGVIQVGENFVILFCEGYTKPVGNVTFEDVKKQLYADIVEKKQRIAMAETFEAIKAEATIDNYLAGTTHSPKRDKELLDQELANEVNKPARAANRPGATTARSAPRR